MTSNNSTTSKNERHFWTPNWRFLLGPPSWRLLLVGYLIAAAFAAIVILLAFAARAEDYHEPYDQCVARQAMAAAYDKSGWLKEHMDEILAEQCDKSPHKDEIAGDVGTQQPLTPKDIWGDVGMKPSLVMNICDAGMPCGEKTDKQTLWTAYQFCQTTLWRQFCDNGCVAVPRDFAAMSNESPYIDKACPGIVSRWESSSWKKAKDEFDKSEAEKEIAHAKAFVEAVARQK